LPRFDYCSLAAQEFCNTFAPKADIGAAQINVC
jgi:hypothetical protein